MPIVPIVIRAAVFFSTMAVFGYVTGRIFGATFEKGLRHSPAGPALVASGDISPAANDDNVVNIKK